MKNTSREHAWTSCLFWNATNCDRKLGIYYNRQRTKYYNSDFFKQVGAAVGIACPTVDPRSTG